MLIVEEINRSLLLCDMYPEDTKHHAGLPPVTQMSSVASMYLDAALCPRF